MTQEVYRRLAQRLDALPNGFPATESGIELRLLAKIFEPEEAALASVMRLTCEPAADLADRIGQEPAAVRSRLKTMARKGQIRIRKREGRLAFGLRPFVVGFFEEQLPRMDVEMATLYERYLQEAHSAGLTSGEPALHRVVVVEEAIPFGLEIYDHERATELLEGATSWGVRDCICRIQQALIGKGCGRPTENCLVFAPIAGAFDRDPVTRAITREESLAILRQAEESGLVHTTGNYRDGLTYICNCCTCCCGILRGVAEFGIPSAVAHSGFRAVVDPEICVGCGDCVERCQFDALSAEETCTVDQARCVGCGLCISACAAGAIGVERRDETPLTPANLREWMARRARERNISLDDVT